MSGQEESEKKCFTFIWKLENVSYSWQGFEEFIESSPFIVDELEETKWKLRLYDLFGLRNGYIQFYLRRDADIKCTGSVLLTCELAFLASDGKVLRSLGKVTKTIEKDGCCGSCIFAPRNEVFFTRRSKFLPQDILTTRCRIWKSSGEFSKDIRCFARTRIVVEKRSFLWNVKNFSFLGSATKRTYDLKSPANGEQLMALELFTTGGQILDENIRFAIALNYERIKTASFQMFVVDASKKLVECFQDEYCCRDPVNRKEFNIFLTKKMLMEHKTVYLPDDVLSLQCDLSFSTGIVHQEFNSMSDGVANGNNVPDGRHFLNEKDLTVPKCLLIDNLKSMLNNSCLPDVKLRTKNQIYPAHTFILGDLSPVFKTMFSNDMKEKNTKCVDIEDLNEDTVQRMLRYIYCAEVEELEWDCATQLYEAADKYEILNLRDICSCYLKKNLDSSNACEALVLADLHQDVDLKGFVLDYVPKHRKDIIKSEGWKPLKENHLKLAIEILRRQI